MLGWVYQSYLYYLPQYYQNVRGYSAIVSAALSAPIAITQAIASILSGQYISRRKRYGEVIWFGFGMWTLGAGLTILFDRNTHPAICVAALSIIGVGVGNVFQPTLVALQAHSPKRQRAVIISNRNFVRCTGGACGLAISATILQTGLLANLPTRFKYIAASIYSFPHFSDPQSADIVLSAYMKATKVLYIVNTAVIGLCFCACFLVHDKGLQRKEDITANNAMTAPQDEKSTQARQP
jgi:MFS family permease